MEYITSKVRKMLTNEPYILSASELRDMMRQNQYDVAETQHVTESSKCGESYYKDVTTLGPGPGNLVTDQKLFVHVGLSAFEAMDAKVVWIVEAAFVPCVERTMEPDFSGNRGRVLA